MILASPALAAPAAPRRIVSAGAATGADRALVDDAALATAEDDSAERSSGRVLGLLLMTLLPAAFWTSLLAVGSSALGAAVSDQTLLLVGGAIAGFLAVICSTLSLGRCAVSR